jgi:hypothetical protein
MRACSSFLGSHGLDIHVLEELVVGCSVFVRMNLAITVTVSHYNYLLLSYSNLPLQWNCGCFKIAETYRNTPRVCAGLLNLYYYILFLLWIKEEW